MNVCRRGRAQPSRARSARSTSASTDRASAATVGRLTAFATATTPEKSSSEAIGKPASRTSTPSSSSFTARRTFSASRIEKPGDCSPSRSVVSKIVIRGRTSPAAFMSGHLSDDDGIQERHPFAQFGADLLEQLLLLLLARRLEVPAPAPVLLDPLLGVDAVLDLLEDLLHLPARLVRHDPRAGRVVA